MSAEEEENAMRARLASLQAFQLELQQHQQSSESSQYSQSNLESRFEALAGLPAASTMRAQRGPSSSFSAAEDVETHQPYRTEEEQVLALLQQVAEEQAIQTKWSRAAEDQPPQSLDSLLLASQLLSSESGQGGVLTEQETLELMERFQKLHMAGPQPTEADLALAELDLLEDDADTIEAEQLVESITARSQSEATSSVPDPSNAAAAPPDQQLLKKKRRTLIIDLDDDEDEGGEDKEDAENDSDDDTATEDSDDDSDSY